MRWVLAPVRAIVLSLHVLIGVGIILVIFPFADQRLRNRIKGSWSRILIRLCGARLAAGGVELTADLQRDGFDSVMGGRLVLANHISWMDIFAINAVLPSRFVAKSEIGKWPLLGLLVSGGGTLYIERGRRHAVAAMNRTVSQHLNLGETVVVFAEGTTTDGTQLLPFHSNLIAPAIDVRAPIWPVAIRYTEAGERSTAAAFIGEMGLLTSLVRVLVARGLDIEVSILAPIATDDSSNRHIVARAAREAIARHLQLPLSATGSEIGIDNDSVAAASTPDAGSDAPRANYSSTSCSSSQSR